MAEPLKSEAQGLFRLLRESGDPETVAAMERFVADAPDRELCRINVLAFATDRLLDDERVIATFLHAARLGLFELSWNVLCPGCGGVLDTSGTLKTEGSSCSALKLSKPSIVQAGSRPFNHWRTSGSEKESRCNHGLAAALPITFGAKGRPMGEIVQEWTITERVRWLGPQRLRR